MSCAIERGQFPPWKKGKHVTDIMELAPLPWRVGEWNAGEILDAKGRPVAWMPTRFNIGDDSWRVIANKLAAGPILEAALDRLLATVNYGNADQHEPGCRCVIHEARTALSIARGEVP
jgi:hypothetical protein